MNILMCGTVRLQKSWESADCIRGEQNHQKDAQNCVDRRMEASLDSNHVT